jgi:hypothetical protein
MSITNDSIKSFLEQAKSFNESELWSAVDALQLLLKPKSLQKAADKAAKKAEKESEKVAVAAEKKAKKSKKATVETKILELYDADEEVTSFTYQRKKYYKTNDGYVYNTESEYVGFWSPRTKKIDTSVPKPEYGPVYPD